MKINCVCGHCGHHDNDTGIEINFREKKIFWYCPECKKMNELLIAAEKTAPWPKSRTRR